MVYMYTILYDVYYIASVENNDIYRFFNKTSLTKWDEYEK